jgi:hypothetical protein
MATDRPLRNPQGAYTLKTGRGHEFQNDQPHDVPLSALSQTPRDIFKKSIRRYRSDTGSDRRGFFTQLTFPYTTVIQLILPQSGRGYFLIQNLDAAANLYVGFGFQPSNGIGLKIIPGTAYEPYVVPQNDVFIIGDAAGTCVVLFSSVNG